MIQTGLGDATNRDGHVVAHTTRTRRSIVTGSGLSLHYTLKITLRLTHVKALPPLATIKGEAGHPLDHIKQRHKCSTQVQHIGIAHQATDTLHSTHIEKGDIGY